MRVHKFPTLSPVFLSTLIVAICMFGVSAANVQAATFMVSNTNDSGDGSLRKAIADANTTAGADTIEFDTAGVFATPQTIAVTSGALSIVPFNGSLTINGPGPNMLTIDAGHTSGVFTVGAEGNATILGLTVTGGNGYGILKSNFGLLKVIGVTVTGNTGSGISASGGASVDVIDSTVSNNFSSGNGGGITHFLASSLSVTGSTISGNSAAGSGGGVWVSSDANLSVVNSKITGNSAGADGGGIYRDKNGTLTVIHSTVSGNSAAGSGAGIYNGGGFSVHLLTVEGSTISSNHASAYGGAIMGLSTTLTVTNSTLSGNTAIYGGGVYPQSSPLTLTASTLTANRATIGGGVYVHGAVTLESSIISGNFTGDGNTLNDIDGIGNVASAHNSLIGDAGSAGGVVDGVNGNIVGKDPKLGPLADHGGPTMTHALLPGSPAIDQGSNPNALTTDQRGYLRTYDFAGVPDGPGGATDIGAFELDPDTDGDGVRDFTDNCVSTPNPEKIAFASFRDGNYEIYVMNADGSGQTNLTNNSSGDLEPAFSPDGSKIAFVSNRDGNDEIYVMNADGTNPTRLTNDPASDFSPVFSPDGSKIAFVSIRDGNREIYVMNADGTGQPVNLTNDAAFDQDPAFSPDGSKIAFTSTRDGNAEIYVMNADGSNPTRLTNNSSEDLDPAFSPDGSKIAFSSHRDGNWEIYVMNADGTGQTNLTNQATADDQEPAFSPDGSKIAFTSNTSNREIYVMNLDGTGQTNLTNNAQFDFRPSWGPQADSDGDGIGDACEVQPTTTTIDTPAATQYSDVVVLKSTTTANGSPVTTGSVEFFVNGVSVGTDAVDSNGVATLNTQVLLPAGTYPVTATYSANGSFLGSTSSAANLTVTKENATVTASANNPVSVKVSAPGEKAGPITLCAAIGDAADGSLGNIALAVPVTFTLVPVAPGSQLQQSIAALTAGTACATFNSVPVNVYDVSITVGGNYYTGSGSSVLAVFDPSLGFTTGGGRVINPATGNTLHFGFSFTYDKKGFKGQMLVMEHLADGSVLKLKSNSLSSLSIVSNRAIVLGKANLTDEAGHSTGNLGFRLDVTDNGEPGSSDKFGLKLNTSLGAPIPAFTIDPPQTILGGNIQVPQGVKKP